MGTPNDNSVDKQRSGEKNESIATVTQCGDGGIHSTNVVGQPSIRSPAHLGNYILSVHHPCGEERGSGRPKLSKTLVGFRRMRRRNQDTRKIRFLDHSQDFLAVAATKHIPLILSFGEITILKPTRRGDGITALRLGMKCVGGSARPKSRQRVAFTAPSRISPPPRRLA